VNKLAHGLILRWGINHMIVKILQEYCILQGWLFAKSVGYIHYLPKHLA